MIPKLALDIRNELPEETGFSERNIKRMPAFVPQAVAQTG